MYEKISKLKSKKGMSTIEVVIGVLVFMLVFGFMLDLVMLTWKFNAIAQTNTQLARIAGIQGGILSSAPAHWPGGNGSYMSRSEMQSMVADSFSSAGIRSGDYTIDLPNRRYEYGETFETEITVDYEWEYMSMMLPGNFRQSITSVRPAMSEWKYDYNSWIGE